MALSRGFRKVFHLHYLLGNGLFSPKNHNSTISFSFLESIISMWRSISAPTSYLQMVPEYSEEEAKAKAEKEKAERVESENTDLLLKLMQQVHKPALNSGQNLNKTCPVASKSVSLA